VSVSDWLKWPYQTVYSLVCDWPTRAKVWHTSGRLS
jgi:hypothetical protein